MNNHLKLAVVMAAILIVVRISVTDAQPTLTDRRLKVETWATGMDSPTSLAFLPGSNKAFVLMKNSGKVQLLQGQTLGGAVLDLSVANDGEHGLLGIALHPNFSSNGLVYLDYTASNTDGGDAISNRIAQFKWNGKRLLYQKTLRNLPAGSSNHNGGKMTFGPDGKLYAVIGDQNLQGLTQNAVNSRPLTRTSVVLRMNDDGSSPADNPFFQNVPGSRQGVISDIYAYGIRNSFGIDFDPISKTLWDTENGVSNWDEINRLTPGANSGWTSIQGPKRRNGNTTGPLVSFGVKAGYVDPVFSWQACVAPTDIAFIDDRLGAGRNNDILVGDVNTGTLFSFHVLRNRRGLSLGKPLADGIAFNSDANLLAGQSSVTLGSGFGVITDIAMGPGDGVYVLSLDGNTLYRITQAPAGTSQTSLVLPEPAALLVLATGCVMLLRRKRVNLRRVHPPYSCSPEKSRTSGGSAAWWSVR